jgi:hypothetical protein
MRDALSKFSLAAALRLSGQFRVVGVPECFKTFPKYGPYFRILNVLLGQRTQGDDGFVSLALVD